MFRLTKAILSYPFVKRLREKENVEIFQKLVITTKILIFKIDEIYNLTLRFVLDETLE